MTEENLTLMRILKDSNHYFYIFKNSLGREIKLKVFSGKDFKKDLKVGVIGMAKYNSIWLNEFKAKLNPTTNPTTKTTPSTPKPTPKEKLNKVIESPFDVKNEMCLVQSVLKASVKLVTYESSNDKPMSPNKRINLVKHYMAELYQYIKSGEYKDTELKFIDGDEVMK